jgi:hypothetical protein
VAAANYYDLLGIGHLGQKATTDDIKKGYRTASRAIHPDSATSDADQAIRSAAFLNIKQAYDVLRDPVRRAAYDRGETPEPAPSPQGPPPIDPLRPAREAARRVADHVARESSQIVEQVGQTAVAEVEALATDMVRVGFDVLRQKIFGPAAPAPPSSRAIAPRPRAPKGRR